ncbi:UBA/THIF-type NAD/FAD binding protein [Desulfofarcimen acetoxidans DSM 771]|uniref:UBA/THIF-type NAD/FAD binding protein n=1 Tax=Desulfofarcimen acetoxidans (strain ATCC 49208 / DSM 771 / KCTC 5769 / VKM B-1644 / 5575) TaxID=485916 RepID=C8VZW4_DESAS|nr:tRNA threonylcarbamoyladenosine dehydratase [Desulfofarcimen acetoxidans]ACV63092.1 UBA/THIF-type NAD/FAD binding protein [Desulfofarcimen acetoxidans DSM 771]
MYRFSRTELLIGPEGIKKLSASRIAVFGLGGVGSFAVEALARAGIGSFFLVDHDLVDITNINRQIHAFNDTIGEAKTFLMEQRIKRINPEALVTVAKEFYSPDRGDKFFTEAFDYIIDAIDYIPGKLDLIIRCLHSSTPLISAMGAANKLDATKFKVADISETSVCPLARIIRRELRKAGFNKGIKVVYSTELPVSIQNSADNNFDNKLTFKTRQVVGSISYVPPVMGLLMAGAVVGDLLNDKI